MPGILLFNRWDAGQVVFEDAGIKCVSNLSPVVVPRSGARLRTTSIGKRNINLVERFMNKMMVPGHKGKKHKISSGHCVGKSQTIYNAVRDAFIEIEKKTGKNPLQIFVKAIENASVLEEVAAYRLGGIIARKSVSVSPQRRLDVALRHLTQGIYKADFRKSGKVLLCKLIADELIKAANNDPKSFSVSERSRIEKEAEGAR
jgi:small subunit ribosomal protein S7